MHVESFREHFPQNHPPVNFYMAMNFPFFQQKDFIYIGANVACSILRPKNRGESYTARSFCHLIAHQRLLSWEFDHLSSLEALTLGVEDRTTW